MKPDPIDQLGLRLFEAARSEPVPPNAEQRALYTARRELASRQNRPRFSRWLRSSVWLVAAALAASTVLLLWRKVPQNPLAPESSRSIWRVRDKRPVPEPPPEAVSAPAAPPVSTKGQPRAVAPTPVRSAPATLTDELGTLKVAENALRDGNPTAALEALDRYDHVLRGHRMLAEAKLLRIQALAQAGRSEAASALARRFVEQEPDSPLVDRAKSFIQP